MNNFFSELKRRNVVRVGIAYVVVSWVILQFVDIVETPESKNRHDIRFYVVAILFLIFDLEVVFLFPWAYIFKDTIALGPFLLIEMGVFIGILLVGLFYIWKKDVLIW